MRIEVWGDLVCPWCYIGKRRLERALEALPDGAETEVVFRSFQLDPMAPAHRAQLQLHVLMERYGLSEVRARALEDETALTAHAEGLEFEVEGRLSGNTFDAHRLVHLAKASGLMDAVVERFYRAQFAEARSLFDRDSLVELAGEAGLDREESLEVLAGDRYAAAVLAEAEEARELGATGVPFTVIDRRFGISGAQSPAVFGSAIAEARARASD
ncbi:MAG TPA: DsbA family oxidoreductase [Candidatus Dormibacteraeota bacterium]